MMFFNSFHPPKRALKLRDYALHPTIGLSSISEYSCIRPPDIFLMNVEYSLMNIPIFRQPKPSTAPALVRS
jgi:hypothetical protein